LPIGTRNLTTPWISQGTYGIWRADYGNFSWLINPKGNGTQTINMPYSGHFLATLGYGDATVNTGAAFTTATQFTFSDRDAICVRNS